MLHKTVNYNSIIFVHFVNIQITKIGYNKRKQSTKQINGQLKGRKEKEYEKLHRQESHRSMEESR